MIAIIKQNSVSRLLWVRFFDDSKSDAAIHHMREGDYIVKDAPAFVNQEGEACIQWAHDCIEDGRAIRV